MLSTFDLRVGNGFDVHRLVAGRPCIICGVEIPFDRGLLGHSDADVALHALADALLGAVSMRDIGYHFPDTDERWRGADSRMLLREVVRIIGQRGYRPSNVAAIYAENFETCEDTGACHRTDCSVHTGRIASGSEYAD